MRGLGISLKGLGVAVAYGIAFYWLKQFSPLTLNLPTGLRLALFMLAPTRLWPWLLLGEYGASAYWTLDVKVHHNFTWTWVFIGTFLPVLSGLIPAWLLRRMHGPARFDVPLDMATFVGTAFFAGAFSAGISTLLASTAGNPTNLKFETPALPTLFMMYVTGASTANLVIPPFLSAAKDLWVTGLQVVTQSRAAVYVAAASYIVLGAMFLRHADAAYLTIGRCALFAPVVLITMTRGWRGTAAVMLTCCIALQISERANLEPDLLSVQNAATAAMAGILLFGSLITQQQLQNQAARSQVDALASMVRRHSTRGEAQLRHSAGLMDRLQKTVDDADQRFKEARDREAITQSWWAFSKEVRRDLRNLSDMLHPRLLEEKGLRAAIAGGPLAKLLMSCDIEFDRRLDGRPSLLSTELQMSLYRLSYEGACLLLRAGTPDRVRLKLRIGRVRGGPMYAALRLTAHADHDGWRPALSIASTGLSLEGVNLVAESFDGGASCSKDGHRITVVMFEGFSADPLTLPSGETAAPIDQRDGNTSSLSG